LILILDRLLAERGLSVSDLVRMTDISRSTIDDIRKRHGGRRVNMDKIAAALKLDYEDLFEKENPEPPEQEDERENPSVKYRSTNASLKELVKYQALNPELRGHIQRESNKIGDVDPANSLREATALFDQDKKIDARDKYFMGLRHSWRVSPHLLHQALANYIELAEDNVPVKDIRDIYDALQYNLDYDLALILGTCFARINVKSNDPLDHAIALACFRKMEEFSQG